MGDESKLEEIKDYFKFWSYKGGEWRIRNFENIVDDLIDEIKHKINGISIFGLKIRLPSCLMKGSGDPDKYLHSGMKAHWVSRTSFYRLSLGLK
jgi:hypothetical protein